MPSQPPLLQSHAKEQFQQTGVQTIYFVNTSHLFKNLFVRRKPWFLAVSPNITAG
jgi:hypothetical protein